MDPFPGALQGGTTALLERMPLRQRTSTRSDQDCTQTSIIPHGAWAHETTYRASSDEPEYDKEDRHTSSNGGTTTVQPQPPGRDEHRGRSINRACLDAGSSLRPSRSSTAISDRFCRRFQIQDWSWFEPGRVFAIMNYKKNHVDSGRDDCSREARTTDEIVVGKVHRLVVVKTLDDYCLALPIRTYAGKGLLKDGLQWVNIDAHARIHMSDREPYWLEKEPTSIKGPIVVEPENRKQHLHPASRLCFERAYSIDYNERIMRIGTVTKMSLPFLRAYYQEHHQQSREERREETGIIERF